MTPPDATNGPSLGDLLQRGDLDGLVREVDRLAAVRDWEALLVLRDRCRAAVEELGKQLWGAAQYAEYRVALEAPAEYAALVVVPGAARFALGPLTEVLAQGHGFVEVADHLDEVVAAVVAQERVLRGEDLTEDPRARLHDVGLPGRLQPWEPQYALPTYRASERLDGSPPAPAGQPTAVSSAPGRPIVLDAVERALVELADVWESQSTGEVHAVTVEGDAAGAVAALVPGAARLVPLALPEAFAAMAWAAASGGAHGRRRGGAAGRAAAWWLGHVAAGLDFPAEPDELEFHLEELSWFAFDDGRSPTGWQLRLVVENPGAGWSAAVDASDHRDDDDRDDADVAPG